MRAFFIIVHAYSKLVQAYFTATHTYYVVMHAYLVFMLYYHACILAILWSFALASSRVQNHLYSAVNTRVSFVFGQNPKVFDGAKEGKREGRQQWRRGRPTTEKTKATDHNKAAVTELQALREQLKGIDENTLQHFTRIQYAVGTTTRESLFCGISIILVFLKKNIEEHRLSEHRIVFCFVFCYCVYIRSMCYFRPKR